jgi:hypothetical protein
MADYRLTENPMLVIRTADGAEIRYDQNGADWQTYQLWLQAGNTPDPVPVPIGSPSQNWGPTTFIMLGGYYYGGS